MKTASLTEIKKEFKNLTAEELSEICLKLVKYKKENKELLHYLLFEAQDEKSYISDVKDEIQAQLAGIHKNNIYLAKKSIRKGLKIANKYIKYTGSKQVEIELLLYFCKLLRETNIPISRYTVLDHLYQNQVQKIQKSLNSLHEDIRGDYKEDIEVLSKW